MTNHTDVPDDEPALPTSYLRGGPATSGELWALDRWREARRMQRKPSARWFNQATPFAGLAIAAIFSVWLSVTSPTGLSQMSTGLTITVLILGALIHYERRGYIRLLERYASELDELRTAARAERT